jgi:hypothetical protein
MPSGAGGTALAAYDAVIESSERLTAEFDGLAVLTAGPSQILSAPRRNVPPAPAREPARKHDALAGTETPPPPGQPERLLHALRITDPTMITRAELSDATANALVTEAEAQIDRRRASTELGSRRGR